MSNNDKLLKLFKDYYIANDEYYGLDFAEDSANPDLIEEKENSLIEKMSNIREEIAKFLSELGAHLTDGQVRYMLSSKEDHIRDLISKANV